MSIYPAPLYAPDPFNPTLYSSILSSSITSLTNATLNNCTLNGGLIYLNSNTSLFIKDINNNNKFEFQTDGDFIATGSLTCASNLIFSSLAGSIFCPNGDNNGTSYTVTNGEIATLRGINVGLNTTIQNQLNLKANLNSDVTFTDININRDVASAFTVRAISATDPGVIRFIATNTGNFVQSGTTAVNNQTSSRSIRIGPWWSNNYALNIDVPNNRLGVGFNVNPTVTLDVNGPGRFTSYVERTTDRMNISAISTNTTYSSLEIPSVILVLFSGITITLPQASASNAGTMFTIIVLNETISYTLTSTSLFTGYDGINTISSTNSVTLVKPSKWINNSSTYYLMP